MKNYTIVPFDHHFEIPETIAVCPYCKQKMYAQVNGWTEAPFEAEGLWLADNIETTCESEPEDFESDEFSDYVDSHSEMPYVYKLPVDKVIEDYINRNFRFSR